MLINSFEELRVEKCMQKKSLKSFENEITVLFSVQISKKKKYKKKNFKQNRQQISYNLKLQFFVFAVAFLILFVQLYSLATILFLSNKQFSLKFPSTIMYIGKL